MTIKEIKKQFSYSFCSDEYCIEYSIQIIFMLVQLSLFFVVIGVIKKQLCTMTVSGKSQLNTLTIYM